jgi:N-acetylmuramoyl-L-alanine amidase
MPAITIAIDAGHGSKTNGKRTPPFTKSVDIDHDGKIDIPKGSRYLEHYANVGVAGYLYTELKKRGYKVIKVGWNDENAADDADVSLDSRQQKIKKASCDYSISIHFNAYGDGEQFNKVEGTTVYIHSQSSSDSRRFAEYVLSELKKGYPQQCRGIHTAKLALCNCKTMKTKASILCEMAFMTNKNEAQAYMANKDFWKESANEIANGVDLYCEDNNSEKADTKGIQKLYHTVVAGDTLSKLANANHTTTEELIRLNKLKNPNQLKVGQKLLLMKYRVYVIQQGDSLAELSQAHLGDALRYHEIMKLNQLSSDDVQIGQIIRIPVD